MYNPIYVGDGLLAQIQRCTYLYRFGGHLTMTDFLNSKPTRIKLGKVIKDTQEQSKDTPTIF